MFLGNEYSSEFFQTLLAVPSFSSVAQKSQKQSSRGVFENFVNQRCFPVNFAKFSRSSFHRTSLVAASEKLKAEAVARRCSVKKVFFESLLNSQKTLGPESLFYNLRNATSLK